ncbi:type II toxin-antitoxin system VapC family toxin [Haloarcula salinisoli]|uniref:Ribonuclease VapC n=1 Tax=Haloarcula salinisoli TaxID=2487746 RepID=A0A8J8CB48_9EURY|nr:PIN domain-containing protein [Halomicroarcula salinisoli]MBX0288367.1 PIN domain-containing protein [Halomicroarcula salinisoli]MBX0305849.1 PIN domain-containing protein [Halomicroarcula salinisoli]
MPRALVDSSVLFAALYRRDSDHDRGLEILRAADDGSLPELVVLDYVLAETINGLTTHVGHEAAVDFLARVEENSRFHVDRLTNSGLATAKARFRQHAPFSFVDAAIVGYIETADLEFLYAFDDDFDAAEPVTRLDTPTNPFRP